MECEVIVFCGVDFMAETAAILSPGKTVLLPAEDACCPMAQMITADELRLVRSRHPGAAVVCYVNTTADVKAGSDICCTSSNAVDVVNSLEEEEIIFVPDQNLARYAQRFTTKKILPWEGFCIVTRPDHTCTGAGGKAGPPGRGGAGAPRVPAGSDRSCRPCGKHLRDYKTCLLFGWTGVHHRY